MTIIRTWVCILSLSAFLGPLVPDVVFADQVTPSPSAAGFQLRKGHVEIGGIAGTTLPVSWLRAHKDRRLTMGMFQLGRVMTNQRGAGSFELLLEVAPVLVLRQPQHAFGFAASPLHMRWNLGPSTPHPVSLFAEASAGVVFTNEAVPVRTTAFNFIDQAGFGLRMGRHPRRAWMLGYRFQHISNAGRIKPNPGANFNFVYAGLTFLR